MFEEEIERGVAVLDNVKPQWYHHVDLDALNLDNCYHCVLGQLFGDFEDGVSDLRRITGWSGGDGWQFAAEYGFSVGVMEFEDDEDLDEATARNYDTLTKEWVAAIIKIRQERRHGV